MQSRHDAEQEDSTQKQFEDTTGGTSGLDLENSEVKNELIKQMEQNNEEDDDGNDDDEDYEDDYNEL